MCRICTIKTLPWETHRPQPASAMGYKHKYWQVGDKITWSVLGATGAEIDFIAAGIAQWTEHINLQFIYESNWRKATIRIQLDPSAGSWSYIGTDALGISPGAPTMNFGWLDADRAANDYATVLHEFGHAIGLGHEHQNPYEPFQWNRAEVIRQLSGPPNNWDISTIEHNVLNQVAIDQVDATTLDRKSIMIYFFPDSWTLDGKGSKQNKELSPMDLSFTSTIYPKDEETETVEPFDLYDFCQELYYDGRRINKLTKRQILYLLTRLSVPHDPEARRRELRNHLKDILRRND